MDNPLTNRTSPILVTVRDRAYAAPACLAATATMLLCSALLWAEPVAVRHLEGIVHGFLVLRTLDGAAIADGDLLQLARGARVTSRLTFRFKDGSTSDETAVFSQRAQFRLITDHLVQKGPSFPHPIDMFINAGTGHVTVRYEGDHGEAKQEVEH